MARRSRAAAQAAAANLKQPTPPPPDVSDDEMQDAPASAVSTPHEDGSVVHNSDADGVAEQEPDEEPEPEPASEPSTPVPVQPSIPRKRRLGRPPKNRPPDWDNESTVADGASETGTPQKRRRGRPPTGGGRWAKLKGGPSHVTQVPIDKEGNMMDVIDDEVAMPEDPEGETKVDKMGHLQDGREYRCRTFTILGRGDRLYMLSTEPARCIGFRDSYLFFQKHKQLFKIIIDEPAKRDLIDRTLIPHSYKGRAIGVVTARSVFREFGARIIVGGKKVFDEYKVREAKERGDRKGELADPNDKLPRPGEKYNQNQYVAWHGASSVYHSGGPSIPLPTGKVVDPKKRKVVVTDVNWMLEHAREASRFNSSLVTARRQNWDGIYDPHTNTMHYPKITQPTHARWEQLETPASAAHQGPAPKHGLSSRSDTITNGADHPMEDPLTSQSAPQESRARNGSAFPALNPVISKNYMVVDTEFISPPISSCGAPNVDSRSFGPMGRGLDDLDEEILAELPSDSRKALKEAQAAERQWKTKWRSEAADGLRASLRITYT
ncbi:MAG: hypothetical protein M1833_006412 [Piccolia ochrophora]|nr:MAG: hypothetical protein M1833_006412 [Piccolia ochrophora]